MENSQYENNNTNEKSKQQIKMKQKSVLQLIFLRIRWAIFGILICLIMTFYMRIHYNINNNNVSNLKSEKINIDYLLGTIRGMSDLITQELEYQGVVEQNNVRKIAFFDTQEQYIMIYEANVKAGIDMSKTTITEQEDEVVIKIPHADIKNKQVVPSSIRFYDIKKSFFSSDDGKEQAIEAIKIAEEDIDENANLDRLISNAEEKAQSIIKNLIQNIIGDKRIVFEFIEEETLNN